MQMITLSQALLVLVFRAARVGRRANLTRFCQRCRVDAEALAAAFTLLEERGFLTLDNGDERLTLEGLALGAALSKSWSETRRLLASCRPLAA
jgi:hypothetical protein